MFKLLLPLCRSLPRSIPRAPGLAFAVLAVFAAALSAAPAAHADDCAGTSLEHVRPAGEGAGLHLDVKTESGAWFARVRPVHVNDAPWHRVEGVPGHAHLIAVGPTASGRFALLRAGGGRDDRARILLYDAAPLPADAPRAPLAALDLEVLMTSDELAALRPSVSHLQWLGGPAGEAVRFEPEGGRVALTLVSGRETHLHLDAPWPGVWRWWRTAPAR